MGFWQSWRGILGHGGSVTYLTKRKDIDSTPHYKKHSYFFIYFSFSFFVVSSDFFCNFIYKVISLSGHTNYTHLFPLRCLIEYYYVIA